MPRYHQNFHAKTPRRSSFAPSITFDAANDGAAAAIAAVFAARSAAKQTSLTKVLDTTERNVGTHPAGTRFSASFLCHDAAGRVERHQLRNFYEGDWEGAITSLFTGDGANGMTGMSGPALLVHNASAITSVDLVIRALPGA